ncbi:MAG TPA: hypothetical protein VGP46_08750 [Acidimicrobiales bacterium]|nr:hypothetical protein [Acidimicrobiales bacterium]
MDRLAPLQVSPFRAPGGLPLWAQLLVWLGLVLVWVLGSLLILHRRPRLGAEPVSTSPATSETGTAEGE